MKCSVFLQDLTYKIQSFTRDLTQEKQRQIFKKSFDLWSSATNLRIKEDRNAPNKEVDIHIKFDAGYHQDAYPFDGQGGTLAHAFYPHNNLGEGIYTKRIINQPIKPANTSATMRHVLTLCHTTLCQTRFKAISHLARTRTGTTAITTRQNIHHFRRN